MSFDLIPYPFSCLGEGVKNKKVFPEGSPSFGFAQDKLPLDAPFLMINK